MYSKVKVLGHPLHPMLIAFPVAFYTTTVVCFLVYALNEDMFWFRMGVAANIAGVVTAIIAAIPGFIDWALGIPTGSSAKSTGLQHMLLNVLALILFGISAVIFSNRVDAGSAELGWPLLLPVLGLFVTALAGYWGWTLVQTHHVGVDLTPEQERLDVNRESELRHHDTNISAT